MDWESERNVWEPWTELTHGYVAAINRFVRKGLAEGWDAAGDQPEDPRTEAMATAVVDLVRRANATGQAAGLRGRVATAHAPLIPFMERGSYGVKHVTWIDDDCVVATLGTAWTKQRAVAFHRSGEAVPLVGASLVGRSGDAFAVARPSGIDVSMAWDGPTQTYPLPTGMEDVPPVTQPPKPAGLISAMPLPDGSGALAVSSQGVFHCSKSGVRRLYPTPEGITQELKRFPEYADEGEEFTPHYDMIHAALSPDGALIACGSQDSQHLLLRTDGYCIGAAGPVHSSYPHHAVFSRAGDWVGFNSCHFYNGVSVGIGVDQMSGLYLDEYAEHPNLMVFDEGCRVYDSTWVGDAIALGDAGGYARLRSRLGENLGSPFVGSSIGGMDVSPNGRFLAIGTHAGFLSIVDTQATEPDPAVIGTAGFRELVRFVAWHGEPIWRW